MPASKLNPRFSSEIAPFHIFRFSGLEANTCPYLVPSAVLHGYGVVTEYACHPVCTKEKGEKLRLMAEAGSMAKTTCDGNLEA